MKHLTNLLLFLILCALGVIAWQMEGLNTSQTIQAEMAAKQLSFIKEREEAAAMNAQAVLDELEQEDLARGVVRSGSRNKRHSPKSPR